MLLCCQLRSDSLVYTKLTWIFVAAFRIESYVYVNNRILGFVDMFFDLLTSEFCHENMQTCAYCNLSKAILADGLQHSGEHWKEMSGSSKSFAPTVPWNPSWPHGTTKAETLSVLHHFKARGVVGVVFVFVAFGSFQKKTGGTIMNAMLV